MAWQWDDARKVHVEDGRLLAREQLLSYSQQSLDMSTVSTDVLAAQISSGILTPDKWHDFMREELKHEYIRQYLLGRGGRPQMTAVDWGSIGGSLAEQYRWLRGFKDDIENKDLTEGQIKVRELRGLVTAVSPHPISSIRRAAMYVNSAREAFYRARARAMGFSPDRLPYHPADGGTPCLTRCNCDWNYVAVYDGDELIGWDCYWQLGVSVKHCDGCLERAAESAPFEIRL